MARMPPTAASAAESAVNKGTPYETLSKKMGAENGFEVQAYDNQPDAVQAVLSGRAYATIVGNTSVLYIASQNPPIPRKLTTSIQ